MKGVPVRLVLGARDLENSTIEVMRRDTLQETRPLNGIVEYVKELLDDIQDSIYEKLMTSVQIIRLKWIPMMSLRSR